MARRDHSVTELSRKLQRKDFTQSDIDAVLGALCQEGLLNDARFAESYIRYRRGRGYGPLRIRAELIERGIAQDLIAEPLNAADESWLEDARKAWQKRFKNRLPEDMKARAQQTRFLLYRGFTGEHVNRLFHSNEALIPQDNFVE